MRALRLLLLAAAAAGGTLAVRRWALEPIYVASASMEPTLKVGSRFIADKVSLRLRPLLRGDIVLFPPPNGEPLGVGKRVIGLPGETLEIRAKKVFIDGKELDEPYAVHRRGGVHLLDDDLGPLKIPENGVFVMGDNRDESEDSTSWKDAAGKPVYFVPVASITALVRPLY